MKPASNRFPWMQSMLYEPPPLRLRVRNTPGWLRPALLTLAVIALSLGGALVLGGATSFFAG